MLTASQIKRQLDELPKDQIVELFYDLVKTNQACREFLSLKLEGESALLEKLEACKEQIYKEFYPKRGFGKLRVAKVKEIFADMKRAGKGTIWPFELMVYFCEVAVAYIRAEDDIFESMGDLFTDTYESVIQTLNKEKTPEVYEKYQDRIKAIVDTPGCHCWGIHDSLADSYSELKWANHDEDDDE